jgi:hypothetical protein
MIYPSIAPNEVVAISILAKLTPRYLRAFPLLLRFVLLLLAVLPLTALQAVEPETAQLSFDTKFQKPNALKAAEAPAWLTKVEQQGGFFSDEPQGWRVAASLPKGTGRLSIGIDRKKMNEDLVATILFDAGEAADLIVQLFDAAGRVIDVDLFGNLVDVGQEAVTDTFIIPLRKYPTAEQIVLRRIQGEVSIHGIVLYPAVNESVPNAEALQKLASVLGDPLSPENPLYKGLQQIARQGKVKLERMESKPVDPKDPAAKADKPVRVKYAGAEPPKPGVKVGPVPTDGLVGYWNFERGDATDASGLNHHGVLRGGAQIVPGLHGRAIKLRKNPHPPHAVSWDSVTMAPAAALNLKETITVAAWVKYSTIAPRWGSQIAWFGNSDLGRDPWCLHIYPDGTLEFRTDRSVTGRPKFTVFENEIKLSPAGKPMMNQHVAVWSPGTLAPETWYFVAGTIEKVSSRLRKLKLYINGELVSEVATPETVNYPTEKMWMTIGAVDTGTWQNFDGLIDEVRVYNRALSAPELKGLYGQPRQ